MSEETFPVSLAGRRWELPHLPFRAIKKIQPALFQVYADLGGADMSSRSVAGLGEAQIERLAMAAHVAIAHVDAAMTWEAFLDLPFTLAELMLAFPAIAGAAGLRAVGSSQSENAAPEAPRPAGELISTR